MLKIKEANIHITSKCSGKCPFCYVDNGKTNEIFRCASPHGDTETLKAVIRNIAVAAGADDLVFVGGDPCRHPDLVPLLRHAKSLGLHTCVLSNTHVYRENGVEVPVEGFLEYLDEMHFTLHGTEKVHDAFNGNPGSYRAAIDRLHGFIFCREDSNRSVAIIINLTPETVKGLRGTIEGIIRELKLDPKRDYFVAQRIAPVGRAACDSERWRLNRYDLVQTLETFGYIRQTYGFALYLDAVDAFPWCAVPTRFHWLLTPGGCRWGQPDGVLSILPDGKIQRCALSSRVIGDMLSMKDQAEFSEWYENDRFLKAFREKKHLPERCRTCEHFADCGGGCVIASGGDPYAGELLTDRRDYLADSN